MCVNAGADVHASDTAGLADTMPQCHPTGNLRVNFEGFLPLFLSCQKKKDEGTMDDFIEGLKVFDKDGNGFINSAELRHVLTSLGKC